MRAEKGITLISLIIYILILSVITTIIGTIYTYFYKNTTGMNEDSKAVSSFNKFNMYFLEEVKRENNKVEEVSPDMTYISFKSGNSFLYKNNTIYLNGKKICDDVNSVSFNFLEEENVIVVDLDIGNNNSYSKTMNYVIESISI